MTFHPTAVEDIPRAAWESAYRDALEVIGRNMVTFAQQYPDDTTVGGKYRARRRSHLPDGTNTGWTTSFWPGMLWLAYEHTGQDEYRDAAAAHVARFVDRLDRGEDLDTHDLGFLYTLSCVVPWRLTGDEVARDAALRAVDHLMERHLTPAGIIQAWGDLSDPRQRGRTIIDSLMNTPLLFWASEQTGDSRYADAARTHLIQLRDNILRPDGSTFHTFYWDANTGAPVRGATEQGSSDESCWARGQAWGIYGFAINYRLTGDDSLIDASRRCADYFLDRLPSDHVPYWDLAFGDGSGVPRDSSAAAISVAGLLELASLVPDGDRYRTAANDILSSLTSAYATRAGDESTALLRHGVYDEPKGVGVDEGNLWGDYFYLEALTRALDPVWEQHW